jgi:hypothetical protein
MLPLKPYFDRARTFAEMAAASTQYGPLFTAQRDRAHVPAEFIERVEALPGHWHLLAISEDWCIDSMSAVPWVAALADAARNLDLRVTGRDENPELIDAHLTNGTARSIPVVIVANEDFAETDWWGPRPAPLKALVTGPWQSLEKPERNKEVRRWYAMDKGHAILEEIVSMLERSAATAGVAHSASATAGV